MIAGLALLCIHVVLSLASTTRYMHGEVQCFVQYLETMIPILEHEPLA